MTRRKTHEQLALTRTKSRVARIRRLIEEISHDWFDSECHAISTAADDFGGALLAFEAEFAELWADHAAQESEARDG